MAKNNKSVTDEAIIAALMVSGTAAKAAEMCGISPRTIYNRMTEKSFRTLYKAVRADFLRNTVNELENRAADAVNVIAGIMQDKEASPSDRLKAAQMILDNAAKFAARLQTDEAEVNRESHDFDIDLNFDALKTALDEIE